MSTAFERVQRVLTAVPTEDVVEAKRLELAKLDNIERRLLVVLSQRQPRVDHGRIIWDIDDSGNKVRVIDYGPVVQAAAGLLRVQERRGRLLGLDEPAKLRVETIPLDVVDAEIRSARGEVRRSVLCRPVIRVRSLVEPVGERRKHRLRCRTSCIRAESHEQVRKFDRRK